MNRYLQELATELTRIQPAYEAFAREVNAATRATRSFPPDPEKAAWKAFAQPMAAPPQPVPPQEPRPPRPLSEVLEETTQALVSEQNSGARGNLALYGTATALLATLEECGGKRV